MIVGVGRRCGLLAILLRMRTFEVSVYFTSAYLGHLDVGSTYRLVRTGAAILHSIAISIIGPLHRYQ